MALLAVSLAFLPIAPRAAIWKSTAAGDPSGRILLLLAATIGGPYLLLSATTPLLQRWFHMTRPRAIAVAVVCALEPGLVSGAVQLSAGAGAVFQAQHANVDVVGIVRGLRRVVRMDGVADAERAVAESEAEMSRWTTGLRRLDIAMWLALSACGSVLLLGTTSQITQEIAVFPFLWMAPLSIYLLTFILTFESDRWYRRGIFAVLAGVLAPVTCVVITLSVAISPWKQFAVYAGALFVTCMVCHGELARSRPSPRHLTAFYLTIAAGGALGGVFAALIAPRVFSEFSEYPIGLAGACILGFLGWMRSGALAQWTGRNFAVRVPLMALMFGGIISIYAAAINKQPGIEARRNFYGILRVVERSDKNGPLRELSHGRVQHGLQYLDPDKRHWPTTYYGPAQRRRAGDRRAAASAAGRGRGTRRGNSGRVGTRRRHLPLLRNQSQRRTDRAEVVHVFAGLEGAVPTWCWAMRGFNWSASWPRDTRTIST